jgi:uncharacterized protein YqgQ
MSSKKSNSKYDPETNEFKTYTVTSTQEVGDFEVTTSIETPGQPTVVNPTVFVETGTGPEQSVPYPPNGPEVVTITGADNLTFGDDMRVQYGDNLTQTEKFRMYPSKWIFVTFQREGIHCWPGAKDLPGVEFLANPHRHLFKFRVEVQVFHDDREIEFILFKRELEKLYGDGILELDYKSCEMIADELAKYIKDHYPGRFMKIEVSEDGENGAVGYYEGLIKV